MRSGGRREQRVRGQRRRAAEQPDRLGRDNRRVNEAQDEIAAKERCARGLVERLVLEELLEASLHTVEKLSKEIVKHSPTRGKSAPKAVVPGSAGRHGSRTPEHAGGPSLAECLQAFGGCDLEGAALRLCLQLNVFPANTFLARPTCFLRAESDGDELQAEEGVRL